MAGVALHLNIGRQVGLIAGLRWRLFVNSLRTGQAKAELVALIVLGVLAAVIAATIGLALGVGAYLMVQKGRPQLLALLLWGVFVFWNLFPLILGAFAAQLDIRHLLRFPLRFSAYYLLSLAYGLFDPIAVASLLWLVCMAVGLGRANPALLPWAVLLLAAFAAMNLVLNRVIYTWLERLLSQRSTREKFFVVVILLFLLPQFIGVAVERWGKQAAPFVRALEPVTSVLPPGVAGLGLEAAARATPDVTTAASGVLLLVVYAVGFALLLRRRLLNQYRGEELGESEAPERATPQALPAASAAPFALLASFLPGPVTAMLRKEFRYMTRNGIMWINLIIPPVMALFFALTWNSPRKSSSFMARSPELLFPMSVIYGLMVLTPIALNTFAYDGRGVLTLLAAPVRFREVLLGKNLALGLAIFAQALLIWPLLAVLVAPPGAAAVAATFALLLFAMLLNFTVGNVLSLTSPRGFDFGSFRQRQSGVTILVALLIQIVLIAIVGGAYLTHRFLGTLWIAAGIFFGLALATLPVYSAVLDYCSGLADRRRETLTAKLCK